MGDLMPKMQFRAILMLVIFSFCTGPVWAGVLSDALADHVAGKSNDRFVRVLVIPVSDYEPSALKRSLSRTYASRGDRHKHGMEQLQEIARRSTHLGMRT